MAAAFAYLTQVLLYLLPGQAVFNGLPLNQQMLLSSDSSVTQPLGVVEPHALYGSQVSLSGAMFGSAALTSSCGASRCHAQAALSCHGHHKHALAMSRPLPVKVMQL